MDRVLTRIAVEWCERAFGPKHTCNSRVRALRLIEEVVELGQALNLPREQVVQLVDMVYARPTGRVPQEIGGTMVCLVVLCDAVGVNLDEMFEDELCRVLAKSPEHFAERNKEKLQLGLAG